MRTPIEIVKNRSKSLKNHEISINFYFWAQPQILSKNPENYWESQNSLIPKMIEIVNDTAIFEYFTSETIMDRNFFKFVATFLLSCTNFLKLIFVAPCQNGSEIKSCA